MTPDVGSWNVVVKGSNDEIGLRSIIERLSRDRSRHVRIWVAGRSGNVPGLLRNLLDARHENLSVVLDGDDASRRIVDEVRTLLESRHSHLMMIRPNMEDWLESCCPNDYVLAVSATSVRAKAMRRFPGLPISTKFSLPMLALQAGWPMPLVSH